jgi:acyl carrier protein
VGDVVTRDEVTEEILRIAADITGRPLPPELPPGTPLLRDGVGLDSFGATLLLTRLRETFGVDVADEDLNLDSLASIGTLTTFVTDRLISRPAR